MVYTSDLKSDGASIAGSSPAPGTKDYDRLFNNIFCYIFT